MKPVEYWFKIDSPLEIDYVCAVQDAWPYKTLGGIFASESDIKQILDPVETIGPNMPRKPRNVEVFDNWRGQRWAKAARKITKGTK
jgi:hypothetical protein